MSIRSIKEIQDEKRAFVKQLKHRNSEHIKLLDAQFRNADEKERDDEKKSDA